MPTVFTKIIDGDLPARFVHRDDRCVAFLSIAPLQPGHTLVVPIVEVDHWIDLDADLMAHCTLVAQRIARAQQAAFDCERIGLIVAGYEVPHLHVHVIPTVDMGQLNFANAATHVDRDALESAATAIRAHL